MSVSVYGVVHSADGKVRFTDGPNFSNTNFRLVLAYLGLEPDEWYAGTLNAHDLKARCVTARAVGGALSDDGMPSSRDGGLGTGRALFIDCGLRPGYFADAVEQIEYVADECIFLGTHVTYA